MKCPNCKAECEVSHISGEEAPWYECPNCPFRTKAPNEIIEQLFAFVVVEPNGSEGVPAIKHGQVLLPMIGADMARAESMLGIAQTMANNTRQEMRLYRFSGKELMKIISPKGVE